MNYKKITQKDIEEKVKFKIEKKAFKSEIIHCDKCNIKMKKITVDFEIPNTSLLIHLNSYKCEECGKEFLNGEQAKNLDKALMVSKVLFDKGIVFERSLNNDGYNYFIRFPVQLTKNYKDNLKVDIKPLSATDYFIHLKSE